MKMRLRLASACAALVPCLLSINTTVASTPEDDEVFTPLTAVTVSTPGRPLKSFDISYVDQGRLIPLTQVGLYVVGAARGTGRRVCEDCLA
jgi:hypothetical protein